MILKVGEEELNFSSNPDWKHCYVGTFRPDRIKAIADRFGVNGEMALENILYGFVHRLLIYVY